MFLNSPLISASAFPVTLVIPILNEAESLPELLQAIKAQKHRPDEMIFSDAGSSDGSVALIEAWWQREAWVGAACRVLVLPGAMPGAGRNAGVRLARNGWIAFLDGGITPHHDWLQQLCRHARENKALAVFGLCHFSAQSSFAKTVCALSYGYGALHPVIPASLFARPLFEAIGFFPEHLRAGEDIVWVNALVARYGSREVCSAARVEYTHFPQGWRQVVRKWRLTEAHCVFAGVRTTQQALYLLGLPTLYLLLGFGGSVGLATFTAYLALRGVIDPIRRSADRPWWRGRPSAALRAPLLVLALDLSKWFGIMQGIALKCWRKLALSEEQNARR
ncbi:MAG: glycosyltransferase family A protein [Pseudomonadota bacterium]